MSPRLGETDLIARYFAPLAGPAGLGLRDDAALMRALPGEDLVLTVDALVAGVHFFADDPPGAPPQRDVPGRDAEPGRWRERHRQQGRFVHDASTTQSSGNNAAASMSTSKPL